MMNGNPVATLPLLCLLLLGACARDLKHNTEGISMQAKGPSVITPRELNLGGNMQGILPQLTAETREFRLTDGSEIEVRIDVREPIWKIRLLHEGLEMNGVLKDVPHKALLREVYISDATLTSVAPSTRFSVSLYILDYEKSATWMCILDAVGDKLVIRRYEPVPYPY